MNGATTLSTSILNNMTSTAGTTKSASTSTISVTSLNDSKKPLLATPQPILDTTHRERDSLNLKKPNRAYTFRCEGLLQQEVDSDPHMPKGSPQRKSVAFGSSSKSVEWKAKYSKPLEQLIYPSLQLLNEGDSIPPMSALDEIFIQERVSKNLENIYSPMRPAEAVNETSFLVPSAIDKDINWTVSLHDHPITQKSVKAGIDEMTEVGEDVLRRTLKQKFKIIEEMEAQKSKPKAPDLLEIKRVKPKDQIQKSKALRMQEATDSLNNLVNQSDIDLVRRKLTFEPTNQQTEYHLIPCKSLYLTLVSLY